MSADTTIHSRVNCQESKSLTKYPSGSLRELWAISFPLMLSMMSGSLMIFLDRLLLARFSIDALNACVNATVIAAAWQFAFLTTAAIAEVFVGQYNGAGQHQKIGEPVWQMIWFSLLTGLLFIPLGLFSGPFFLQIQVILTWKLNISNGSCISVLSFVLLQHYPHFTLVAVVYNL